MSKHFFSVVFLVVIASLAMRLWITNAPISASKVGLPA